MAKKSGEQAPAAITAVGMEKRQLSASSIEEIDKLSEAADMASNIKKRTERAKRAKITGAIDTTDERSNANDTGPDGADQPAQPPKKVRSRKPKKPVDPVLPGAETTQVPELKKTRARSPKKSVEPAVLASEGTEMPGATEAVGPVPESTPVATGQEVSRSEEVAVGGTVIEQVSTGGDDRAEIVAAVDAMRVAEEEATTPVAVIEEVPAHPPVTERRHLVKSAALVSLGNLGSSLLGMVRQIVVTPLGPSIAGPFYAALTPANNFFQLLVNGSVSGALIPTFNDYAAPEKRQEMRRIVFTIVNLVFLIALIASIGYTLIAPWFINFLVQGYPDAADKLLTLQYSQIIFFSLAALGPFAVLLAALFALKEFGWPAFATAAYHIGIILGALGVSLFGSFYLGKMALPTGVLLGSLGELVLLLPGIRNQRFYYMFVLDLKHPALRHILRLYLPIALSFVFTTAFVFLDLLLQSFTPTHTTTTVAMATATTLVQFPIGLVAMALSTAVLPTLSEHAREGNNERFKQTLLLGFRLGLLLMIPAMVGLLALRTPIAYLLFAHGKYGTSGADFTALALQNYSYQLPFVAIDQLLIAAFYARKNTKIPVIIGVVSLLFYLIVALPFYRNIGMPALAFANTVQNSSHAIILLFLLRRVMGVLHIRTSVPAILKICAAAALMGLATWAVLLLLNHIPLFSLAHFVGQLLSVIVAGGAAIVVYIGAILLLKVEEINLVKGAVLAKLGKK